MNEPSIYHALGLTPIINAAGTFTELGGSLMSAEVVAAWQEAARHFVDLRELQDRVGERIADRLGVESALVTGGAASGILLGTAAAITLRAPEFVRRQVVSPDGRPWEVIRQRGQRDLYDRQLEACGVVLVDVASADQLSQVVTDRTVMMMAYNYYGSDSEIDHRTWLQFATERAIPTLLDAAADTPPVINLSRYAKRGYDAVVFSGGKAIGGPQNSGLLVGSRKLIEAAKMNAVPNEGTVGRVAKVAKEDIVAFWRALEIHLEQGDQIASRCQGQLQQIVSMLTDLPTVECALITPEVANKFPHLRVIWNELEWRMTVGELTAELRAGMPPIATARVHGTGSDGLLISAIGLQPGEEMVVGERIRMAFLNRL